MAGRRIRTKDTKPMFFTPLNYKILGAGILLIVAGFTAMRIENEVYGFVSLYISPVVILAGYATVVVAILKKDHKIENSSAEA